MEAPLKVSFVYNAGLHQIPHSLPLALELSAGHPDIEVDVVGASERHLEFARRLAAAYGIEAPVRYLPLFRPWDVRLRARLTGELAPMKKRTLRANLAMLAARDAIVTPEWTSLVLRRKLPRTHMVFTSHGAGDRAITVTSSIRGFDFVFTSGAKLEQRMLDLQLIRPGRYATGVYPKFDWVMRSRVPRRPLFDNGRPTILYSPHFQRSLSSWPLVGRKVLDYFAASERYNLVFAPHVRMFESPWRPRHRPFRRYRGLKHMLIDLGSERSIDMSYTLGADVFLGDVSSQVSEFVMRPRPCLFLNPRGTAWQGDPNYLFWTLGPVIEDVRRLGEGLRQALDSHALYESRQRAYFSSTFGEEWGAEPSARRGAHLLASYLRRSIVKGVNAVAATAVLGADSAAPMIDLLPTL